MKLKPHIFKKPGDIMALRHEPEGVRILSDFYWRALLLLAFFVVIVVAAYGAWGLSRVLGDLDSSVSVSTLPPPAMNRNVLEATVDGFEKRRARFESLQTGLPESISDPSR